MATASATPALEARAFEITGADGNKFVIPDGRWYRRPKAKTERLMKNHLSKEARQVYESLEAGSIFYQQECAQVHLGNGQFRPKTTVDIARECGLDPGNVRRALRELELAGLGGRYPLDPTKPLVNGNIGIFCAAVPKEEKPNQGARALVSGFQVPRWFNASDEAVSLLKQWKSKLPETMEDPVERDRVIGLFENAAKAIALIKSGVRDELNSHRAAVAYKEEITKEQRIESQSVSPELVEEWTDDRQTDGPAPDDSEPTDPTDGPTDSPEPDLTPPPPPPDDPAPVIQAAAQVHGIHLAAEDAIEIVEAAREELKDPSITPEETARFVQCVTPIRPNSSIRHPRGFLKRATINEMRKKGELAALRNTRPPAPVEPVANLLSLEICGKCGSRGFFWHGDRSAIPRLDFDIAIASTRGEATICDCVCGQAIAVHLE